MVFLISNFSHFSTYFNITGDHEARKIIKETQRLVTEYAKQGLRTLVMAKKVGINFMNVPL